MKTCKEIYEQMCAVYKERTGYAILDSCDMAVRLYASAAQLEALYCYADWCKKQAFPQTASGIYLDYHGQMRRLTRREGTKATGLIRFFVAAALERDLTVPVGTVVTTQEQVRFVTTTVCTVEAGKLYGDCYAKAEEAGSNGNILAGVATCLTLAPVGIQGCTNPSAFSGGRETESDEDFRERILDSFAAISNGGNPAFYEEIARQYPDVAAVSVLPRVNGLGSVKVVVASRSGIPTSSMISAIQQGMEAQREVSVDVTVAAPSAVTVNLAMTLWPAENVTYEAAAAGVTTAVKNYFTGRLLGQNLYLSVIYGLVYNTGLVKNCHITTPTGDVSTSNAALPVLGTLTLTEGQ